MCWDGVPAVIKKPLNVRVAEALGCKPQWEPAVGFVALGRPGAGYWVCRCQPPAGRLFGAHVGDADGSIQPYGEDSPEGWACTGPLMRKYRVGLMPTVCAMSPPLPGTTWIAKDEVSGVWSDNPEPLHALCEVILTLVANGRLPK